MKPTFLIGRLIFGGYFLYNGINHFLNRAMMTGFAASHGVPFPELAIPAAGAMLLIAGTSIVLGWKPVVGIAATVLFLLPVSVYMHPFWSEAGAARMNDMINFTKNIALMASALMFAAIPRPWPASVESPRSGAEPVAFPVREEPSRSAVR